MMRCCTNSSSNISPKRHICPLNGKEYLQVPYSTVLQHIKKPWDVKNASVSAQNYYFCDDPNCDVVYFGEDDSLINKSQLKTLVGIKEPDNLDALVCYCFDISHGDAKKHPNARQYVIEKTKNNLCACESQNPSGRCCLKDFPKSILE